MPLENPVPGSPEDWIRYAVSDLELARVSLPPGVLREGLCFHAQQAVEKALKAILIFQSVPIQRTHNIGILIDLLSKHVHIPDSIDESAVLTDYAVTTRYPGDHELVSEDEYKEAIRLAEAVVSWAKDIVTQTTQDTETAQPGAQPDGLSPAG